jgi:methylenetetrahydrofolate dehydrogenase (NADP+)/methenyltetrahydrofolate cyclohydrolase
MYFKIDRSALRDVASGAEPKILDGKRIADALLEQIKDAAGLLAERDIRPHLAVVRVGSDPASKIYVRHKIRACERAGLESSHIELDGDISQDALLARLDELNADEEVHGVLLQLPLPGDLKAQQAILRIDPEKDADGFHPLNLGCLMSSHATLEPCTPRGIMTLFDAFNVDCKGKRAVVVGRSMIVGRPMSLMLLRAHATVTTCHRHTQDLESHIRDADIVVVATGVPGLIKGEWIKEGAVIADVGMNRLESGKLIGDVEFGPALERASYITPVPRGVGPMTVATLLENTLQATCKHHGLVVRGGDIEEL